MWGNIQSTVIFSTVQVEFIWFSSHLFVPLHQKSVSISYMKMKKKSATGDAVAGRGFP